jgi:mRNA-degrading endonuclease RelE of RelBE toxin-antitoxin system
MTYRLRYDRSFMQQLVALPGDVRGIARRTVAELAETPRSARAKELDEHPGYYRLWLPCDHRLIWQVLDG